MLFQTRLSSLVTSCWPGLSLACVVFTSASLSAAPPVATYLFPAGAQIGSTVTITVGGTFERWPVQVWVSGEGIEAKAGKEKGKLTLSVRPDAIPGAYWLRFYDEQGASVPRPFVVGTLP